MTYRPRQLSIPLGDGRLSVSAMLFFRTLSQRKDRFHGPVAPVLPHPLAPPCIRSSNNLGPDGATAIAAPLALLTSLQTMDLQCAPAALRACEGGGGRENFSLSLSVSLSISLSLYISLCQSHFL